MSSCKQFVDKDGVLLQPGQSVMVQYCVGSYGRVSCITAKLLDVNLQGIELCLSCDSQPFEQHHGLLATTTVNPGDSFWIAMHYTQADEFVRGYYVHDDAEHHHETWIKVLNSHECFSSIPSPTT